LERTDEELLCQENYVDFEQDLKDNPTKNSDCRLLAFCSGFSQAHYRANTSRLFAGSARAAEWLKSCSGWGGKALEP